jgi:subtilisin family serine protease
MQDISVIIIRQIKDILKQKGENLDDYSFEGTCWEVIMSNGDHSITINYEKYGIFVTVPSEKWAHKLRKIICKFINDGMDSCCRWILTTSEDHDRSLIQNMTINHTFDHAFCGFSCMATENEIKKMMQGNSKITGYVKDQKVSAAVVKDSLRILRATNLTQTVGGFIKRLGDDRSSRKAGTGSPSVPINPNVYAFVVDTGIDATHPDLNIDAMVSKNFVGTNATLWNDQNGHGTHVGGIIGAIDNGKGIVGIAPGTKLVAIRVLDADGSGYYSDIIAGLNYILQWQTNNPTKKAIVNMSLGGPANTSFDNAVKKLLTANIPVVVAGGNEAQNVSFVSPARIPNAITVGAYDSTNNKYASWSNYGKGTDILAPGVNIDSTYMGGGYAVLSGTSMATPVVVGSIVCLLTTNPSLKTLTAITNALINDARILSPKNYDNTTGSNPNIVLTYRQYGTTNRSVYVGKY